jgi:hypothetical protein
MATFVLSNPPLSGGSQVYYTAPPNTPATPVYQLTQGGSLPGSPNLPMYTLSAPGSIATNTIPNTVSFQQPNTLLPVSSQQQPMVLIPNQQPTVLIPTPVSNSGVREEVIEVREAPRRALPSRTVTIRRGGNFWYIYIDAAGNRSRVWNFGELSVKEITELDNLAKDMVDRIYQLQEGKAEPDAYALSSYIGTKKATIPATGSIYLIDELDEDLEDATVTWTRRELEGYILAPYDPMHTASLGMARIPAVLKKWIY